jgi:hypothetical protein
VPRAAADLAEARAAAGPKWQTDSTTARTCKTQLLLVVHIIQPCSS